MSDLISREALLLALCESCGKAGMCRMPCVDYDLIIQAPAVDAEPVRHGTWIVQDDTYTRFECSNCGTKNQDGVGNYCPYCGAKMEGDKND